MFCSTCGASVAQGIKYCNLCGARLSGGRGGGDAGGAAELSPESLVWAAVAVFVVGLCGLIGLLAVMKETVGFGNDVIIAVTAAFLLLMICIEAVLVGLLLRRTRAVKGAGAAEPPQAAETRELGAAQPHALPEHVPTEPVPSVTEHTTRAFEPSRVERGAAKR